MKAVILVAFISAMFAGSASAQTAEAQRACTDDAFRLCGAFIPDRDRVTACMIQNRNRVSAPCLAVMANYGRTDSQGKTYSARRVIGTTGSRVADE